MEKLQSVKGFKDILPDEAPSRLAIEQTARDVFEAYGYNEIRTPLLEYTELFERSIGSETDIVEKEMFTFEDPGGRSLTLRPENTAGVVRAYIDNGLYKSHPRLKVYYIGPMFRRERPQKGRLRQFHQIGAEAFGSASALIDAEQIAMLDSFFKKLDIGGLDIVVNSLGCPVCRPKYRTDLMGFLNSIPAQNLCESCIKRRETNPLRVLDCKSEKCRESIKQAPAIFAYLCETCKSHQERFEKYLAVFGVKYRLDSRLVRGLDYYTRTVFEFISGDIGAQSAVCAGGRYDYLVEQLGGPQTPATGFAVGIERLAMLFQSKKKNKSPDVFLALLGEEACIEGIGMAMELRAAGYSCEMDYEQRSLKGQMKLADRLQAKFVLIIGDDEVKNGTAVLQNMADGAKESISIREGAVVALSKIIGK